MKEINCKCLNCDSLFLADTREVNRGNAKYCCKTCFHQYRKQHPKKLKNNVCCNWCKADFHRAASKIKKFNFCCRKCKDEAQKISGLKDFNLPHYGSGKHFSYHKYAFENFPHKCNRCGYSNYVKILQVHHKDRDKSNNSLENLEILCPNCHSEDHYLRGDGFFLKKK